MSWEARTPCMATSYLAACLCFQNASRYLGEWLAFYRLLGVEHFYLYNNESTDEFAGTIAPYVARGIATRIDYPGRGVQQAIYQHCLREFGARARWMMFCDDDEFLFPVEDVPLPEIIAGFEGYAGVAVSWLLYGSSGYEFPGDELVIERYRRRRAAVDPHVKCVVDPAKVVGPAVIGHHFHAREGEAIVNEYGVPLRGPMCSRPSADLLRINHYLTKSRAELVERRSRVQANTGALSPHTIAEWLEFEQKWNEVEDPVAQRYVERVKMGMAEMA